MVGGGAALARAALLCVRRDEKSGCAPSAVSCGRPANAARLSGQLSAVRHHLRARGGRTGEEKCERREETNGLEATRLVGASTRARGRPGLSGVPRTAWARVPGSCKARAGRSRRPRGLGLCGRRRRRGAPPARALQPPIRRPGRPPSRFASWWARRENPRGDESARRVVVPQSRFGSFATDTETPSGIRCETPVSPSAVEGGLAPAALRWRYFRR